MLCVVAYYVLAFVDDHTGAWSEAISPAAHASASGDPARINVISEITAGRQMPAGRIDGEKAFIYWSERLVEPPQLTSIDLSTGKLIGQLPLTSRTDEILFTARHLIVVERFPMPNPAVSNRSETKVRMRAYDRETLEPGFELTFDETRWFRLLQWKWLVFSTGEIRDADSGDVVATGQFQAIWSAMAVGGSLVILEGETLPESDKPLTYIHRVDLATGTTLSRLPVSDQIGQEDVSLYGADERCVILQLAQWAGNGRVLLSIDTDSAKSKWRTPLLLHAPVRFVNLPADSVTLHHRGNDIPAAAAVDVDWNTGALHLPSDRPSPASRFDWYVPARSELLALRIMDGALFGWMKIAGSDSALIRINPQTGEREWSRTIYHDLLSAHWFPELSPTAQFAVFPAYDEIQVVQVHTGRFTAISVASLGLTPAAPQQDMRALPVDTEKPSDLSQRMGHVTLLCLAGMMLLSVTLWEIRKRSRSNQNAAATHGISSAPKTVNNEQRHTP